MCNPCLGHNKNELQKENMKKNFAFIQTLYYYNNIKYNLFLWNLSDGGGSEVPYRNRNYVILIYDIKLYSDEYYIIMSMVVHLLK